MEIGFDSVNTDIFTNHRPKRLNFMQKVYQFSKLTELNDQACASSSTPWGGGEYPTFLPKF